MISEGGVCGEGVAGQVMGGAVFVGRGLGREARVGAVVMGRELGDR